MKGGTDMPVCIGDTWLGGGLNGGGGGRRRGGQICQYVLVILGWVWD